MIFAETERLRLRALTKEDLPHFTELFGEWDIAKWLARAPHPYTLEHAEWWLNRMSVSYNRGEPEFFIIAHKEDDRILGGVGLHPQTSPEPKPDELELGYWLGKPYWGHGIMSEAVHAILGVGFARENLNKITVFTDPGNHASQNVLRKAGFRYLGMGPRVESGCLRGSNTVTRWEMTREDFDVLHKQGR